MAAPFVHIELATDDVPKAKEFYRALFGWKIQDLPGQDYAIIDTGKEPGGGLFQRPEGAPAGWTVYVGIPDANEALAKVRALGGKVLRERTEISPEWGAFAVIQDPTGAVICLHEAAPMQTGREAMPPPV